MDNYQSDYNPAGIRASSPTSSIGTAHFDDETSLSDAEDVLSQAAFEAKCEARIGLGKKRLDEEENEADPLLKVPDTPAERKELAEKILAGLRITISQLREEELFERNAQSSAYVEPVPSVSDVDAILEGMMPPKPQPAQEDTSFTNGSISAMGRRR
ncbi:hypothetical protein CYLTODRAFT_423560 [Cylindrobasidium torrendii FP15055 ss-10]|uniref:Uncharacterized protein n=1 Tax=Cylindrobasidium torrendii FP15055 ss-10 TaxID=1314674 RepID=A0A0D7B800_9AGAR|nr:hypothetical protein CYLTODRAFT_423560 [Cylindrobasidium torrendii FP15055 ss-10]